MFIEIPIYSITESEFNKRENKKKERRQEDLISGGNPVEMAQEIMQKDSQFSQVWKYNKIIGYVTITVSKQDMWFHIYCKSYYKMFASKGRNSNIVERQSLFNHFPIDCSMTNSDIRKKAKSCLHIIEKSDFKNKLYLDYDVFDNTFEYLDVRRIVNGI
jgi:hypothetical protein